jgi:hypothetical protein
MQATFLWAEFTNTPISDDDKWQSIRMHRNRLLSASDWTQLPDAPLTPEKKPPGQPTARPYEIFPSSSSTQTMLPFRINHK